ncbi:hypothetical protein D3C86_1308540 [compost metagenome]
MKNQPQDLAKDAGQHAHQPAENGPGATATQSPQDAGADDNACYGCQRKSHGQAQNLARPATGLRPQQIAHQGAKTALRLEKPVQNSGYRVAMGLQAGEPVRIFPDCAGIFRRSRESGGNRSGRCAANRAETVSARQFQNRIGINDTGGDAALHHHVAFLFRCCEHIGLVSGKLILGHAYLPRRPLIESRQTQCE